MRGFHRGGMYSIPFKRSVGRENGETFREIVLLAANLGDDADTTAASQDKLQGHCTGFQAVKIIKLS